MEQTCRVGCFVPISDVEPWLSAEVALETYKPKRESRRHDAIPLIGIIAPT